MEKSMSYEEKVAQFRGVVESVRENGPFKNYVSIVIQGGLPTMLIQNEGDETVAIISLNGKSCAQLISLLTQSFELARVGWDGG